VVIGAFAVIFALAVAYRIGAALNLGGTIAVLALTVMCESELQALNNPFYNLHRLGLMFLNRAPQRVRRGRVHR
jgi:hypothetical protein